MSASVGSGRLSTPSGVAGVRSSARLPVARSRARCARAGLAGTVRAEANGKGERQPWDLGRFAKTVLFFNKPPSPGELLSNLASAPLRLLQSLASNDMEQQKSAVLTVLAPGARSSAGQQAAASSGGGVQRGVVLVAGATGGVGKRVVRILMERGFTVRALVRDLAKAKDMLVFPGLPGRLEVAAADLTQRATLVPEIFEGVSAVVACSAVKVAPKEGDTADRAKYMQGIKFYSPEIVGDTPETVEYLGMTNLVDAVKSHLGLQDGLPVFVPGDKETQATWGALDDVVMGGVSESELVVQPNGGEDGGPVGVFRGVVRTENSGGFASVRTRNYEPNGLDLSPYEGLELRVQGNGLRFKLIIRTDTNWDGIAYCKSFDTVDGEWQTVRLPFSEFDPVFRAKTLPDGERLDPSSIASIQLMLSKFEYDGQLSPAFKAGPFQLPIQSINAYMPDDLAPRFVHVSSAGVTRPNRPGINVDVEPPAVRMNDELGGILTYKLKGEDVIRESGIPYAIVRPTALTEEPSGAELIVDQGDVIKGKISREDVADLLVSLLRLPRALDTTFEVSSTVPFSQPWEGPPVEDRDWAALLADTRPGVTGKTVNGVYTGKEPEAAAAGRQEAGVA